MNLSSLQFYWPLMLLLDVLVLSTAGSTHPCDAPIPWDSLLRFQSAPDSLPHNHLKLSVFLRVLALVRTAILKAPVADNCAGINILIRQRALPRRSLPLAVTSTVAIRSELIQIPYIQGRFKFEIPEVYIDGSVEVTQADDEVHVFVTHFIVPHMPSLEFSKGKDSDDNNSPPLSDGASAGIIIVDS
ncbi:hypothetical protein B0H14DRAFT_2556204 [Mycena olivaceomarginata]|nr:hypothetical protein B0H14DRAFT_2556204 [Mycena olivaceomarginata]